MKKLRGLMVTRFQDGSSRKDNEKEANKWSVISAVCRN